MHRSVDLHCHSFASPDATGYPKDIARHFQSTGHAAFSLTDHNSVRGHEEAAAAAKEYGIEFVPGVEVASSAAHLPEFYSGGGQDILCYYFEKTPDVLSLMQPEAKFLGMIHNAIEALSQQGVADLSPGLYDEALSSRHGSYAGFPGIQRETFCDLLIERGVLDPGQADEWGCSMVEWRRQAGRKALTKYGPPKKNEAQPNQKIEHISRVMREAGAVMILAHPGRGKREPTAAEKKRIHLLLEHFVDGVEIYHHANSPAYREMLFEIVAERQCPWTGGTDLHSYAAREIRKSEALMECLDSIKKYHSKK